MRVGLCLAAHDYGSSWFSYDLAGLSMMTVRERPTIDLVRFQSTGTWLPQVRHRTIVAALNAGCDYLLFLDNDMRFPPETLLKMLDHERLVVACNYTARHVPFPPVAVNLRGERVFTDYESSGLEEVGSIGMGVMLVAAPILRSISPPWFMLGWDPERQDYKGEDTYFCKKLREAGASIWLDHDLSHDVTHLGVIEFEQSHARKAQAVEQTNAQTPKQ